MRIRILRVSSKMPRKRDWENNFLDIVEVGNASGVGPCLFYHLKW